MPQASQKVKEERAESSELPNRKHEMDGHEEAKPGKFLMILRPRAFSMALIRGGLKDVFSRPVRFKVLSGCLNVSDDLAGQRLRRNEFSFWTDLLQENDIQYSAVEIFFGIQQYSLKAEPVPSECRPEADVGDRGI